jgi:ankyrin repeat protein
MSMAALILEFKRFKRPCDCCKGHGVLLHQTRKMISSSSFGPEKSDTMIRATTSHSLNHGPFECLCTLNGTVIVTDTAHERRYVSSIHLKVLSKLVVSVDLMVRMRSWSSLSLDGSSISMRHFVREDSEFMIASGRGDVVTMRRLLNGKKATPFDVTDGNITPLALAIQSGTVEAVDLLLTCGADINDVFGLKQTSPLAWALKQRSLDVARLLVERGASFHHLSIWGWSPLFYLWSRTIRHPSSIEYLQLLRSKHDFSWLHDSLIDIEGWGLMHRAAIFGTPEDVLMLIRFGVDPCQQIGDYGWMVLHNVVYYGIVDVFLVLLPYYEHLGIELPDHRGWTLLHIAAGEGHEEMMYELLQRGADADAITKPAWVDIPDSIRGKCCSIAEVAHASGEDKYSTFARVVAAVNGEEVWHEASETRYD